MMFVIRICIVRSNCGCGKRQFAFEVRPVQHTYQQQTHLPLGVKKARKVVKKIPLLSHVSLVSDLPGGIRKKAVETRRRILILQLFARTSRQTKDATTAGKERRNAS